MLRKKQIVAQTFEEAERKLKSKGKKKQRQDTTFGWESKDMRSQTVLELILQFSIRVLKRC